MVDHHNGSSHHNLRADRVVARVEKSVNMIVGHRQQRQASSREHGGESKPKYTTMKIPKWKHYDSENKVSYQKDNNEPPTMIVSGGWVRPNRAMWASPPNSSSSKPQNNT